MANRLIAETSPYLRQHADDPVDWFPWGEEAFRRAKELDRPIFLSIGYSACHWCHVMERESFSDPEVARLLNDHFVAIKVDREEHPEVDAQYMEVVQILTGGGGWPLSIFLTPELQAFFGGTYWPRETRFGTPGFVEVLRAVIDSWQKRRQEVLEEADKVTVLLADISGTLPGRQPVFDQRAAEVAEQVLAREFDPQWGGFGGAPKFPHPSLLRFLLLRGAWLPSRFAQRMAQVTLDAMADGGLYDHIGGGFHRYSTDERWLVPHFEKMLYDNALLARAYLDAYRLTGSDRYREVVCETLDYLLRDMQQPEGGFYASQDADSEGQEGRFYLWSDEDIRRVLGTAAGLFAQYYDVSAIGPWAGKSVPNRLRRREEWEKLRPEDRAALESELRHLREKLRQVRSLRVPPARDVKIVLSWNAFAAEAFLLAGCALARDEYLDAGQRTLQFLLNHLQDNGRFVHSWCDGRRGAPAVLDDLTALATALITGFETLNEGAYLERADALLRDVLARFYDPNSGAFFMTTDEHLHLLCRRLDYFDNPTPSGTALAAEALLRLGYLVGEQSYLDTAQRILQALGGWMQRAPMGVGHALYVLQSLSKPWSTWVIILPQDGRQESPAPAGAVGESPAINSPNNPWLWRHRLFREYLPPTVAAVTHSPASSAKLTVTGVSERVFADRVPLHGQPTAYLCQGFSCREPLCGEDAVQAAIREQSLSADSPSDLLHLRENPLPMPQPMSDKPLGDTAPHKPYPAPGSDG